MKRIVAVFISLLTILSIQAQTKTSVGGIVLDATNQQPIEFAAVTITLQNDSSIITGAITDAEGKFKLADLNPGKYSLHYNFIGYKDQSKDIELKGDQPFVPAGKVMMEVDATDLNTVNVTAEKAYFQSSIDKKVYNIDKDIVASSGSASDALQTIPSVVIDIDGNISLRGNEGVRIFIDGKPSGIVGSNMNAILEQIPASSIESIEVVTNPSARYDAEGNSGIINIVLKKNKKSGLNGNVSAGISTSPKVDVGASLNFRNQKLNFYSNYGYTHDDRGGYSTNFRKTFDTDTISYFNSDGTNNSISHMHMLRAGVDLYLDPKTTLGFSGSATANGVERDDIYDYSFLDLDSILTSTSYRTSTSINTGLNFSVGSSYRHTFENPKHLLSAEGYFSKGAGETNDEYDEQFYDPLHIALGDPVLQNVTKPSDNTDASLQSDYVHPFKNGNQFETGIKYTLEIKDNSIESESFDPVLDQFTSDDSINNHFVYNENVVAAYLIWNSSIKKFGYQIGLRAEQTYTHSELLTTDESFRDDYFGLFPSAHIVYKFNPETELGASYSRRIDRPNSWFLNPFLDYSDPYSFRIGNPFLEPEYENSYEISFTKDFKKHSLSASVYFNQTLNEISPYTVVTPEGISYMTFQNYNHEQKYGVELVGKNEFYKWWNMTSSINFNQTLLDAQNLEAGLTNSQFTYNVRVMSFFQVLKSTAFQLTFSYNTPWTFAQGESEPVYFLDAGLKSDFFQNKLSVSLAMSDVFNTRVWEGHSAGINFYSDYSRKRESQIGSLKLTYKFGQQDNSRRKGNRNMDENYDGGMDMF